MASGYIAVGGGGGSGSDDCTATKNDVLKGKTAITSDSDDEAAEGTLELTGNAGVGGVLESKTFYSTDPKSKQTGTMPDRTKLDPAVGGINSSYPTVPVHIGQQCQYTQTEKSKQYVFAIVPKTGYYQDTGHTWVGIASAEAEKAIGLTADKLWPGARIMSIVSNKQSMAGQTITPSKSQQTVSCSGKAMTGNIVVNAIPSNFVDTSVNQDLFRNGSYGAIAVGAKTLKNQTPSGALMEFVGVEEKRLRWYFRKTSTTESGRPYTGSITRYTVWFKKKILLTNYKTLEMCFCSDTLGARNMYLRISPDLYMSQTVPPANESGLTRVEPSHYKDYAADKNWKRYNYYVNIHTAYNGDNSIPKVQYDVSDKNGWWYIGFKISQFQSGFDDVFLNINEEFDVVYATLKTTAVGQ